MATQSSNLKWKNPTTGSFRSSDGITYERWVTIVSRGIQHITGLPLECGEDVASYDWYEADFTVNQAIDEVLDAWGFSVFDD